MLKKSINRWAFHADTSVDECIVLSEKHGFDGLELNLEEEGDFSLKTREKAVVKIAETVDKSSIEISSICSLLFWKYPITSRDEKIRKKGMDIIKMMVDYAAILQVKNILVVPGMVHADPPLDFGNPPIPYSEAWQRATDVLLELSDYALPSGVVLGLENVYYNKFLLSPMEWKNFLTGIGRDNVRLYFDVGNVMLCGFPEDWIEYLAEYICSIHLKDFDKNINTLYGWKNIFEGHISWDKVTDALRKAGYSGYLVGEPSLSPYLYQQEELIKTTSSAIDRVREMITR